MLDVISCLWILVATPPQPGADLSVRHLRPLTLRSAVALPRVTAHTAARGIRSTPKSLAELSGWGRGTQKQWLEYARGQRIVRTGSWLLATGVTGLVLTVSFGIPGILLSPSFVSRNLASGLFMGFGMASTILTYVGASLLVKGRRIRQRAVLEILQFKSRSGSVRGGVRLGVGSVQLGGQF